MTPVTVNPSVAASHTSSLAYKDPKPAADYGLWDKERIVLVEIELANGQKLGHWFPLEPPAGRLMGKMVERLRHLRALSRIRILQAKSTNNDIAASLCSEGFPVVIGSESKS